MLVLSRKIGESICIGDNIEIKITKTQSNRVHIGIQAPREVSIHRGELSIDCDAGLPMTTSDATGHRA